MPPEQYRSQRYPFFAKRVLAAPMTVLGKRRNGLSPDGTKGIRRIDKVKIIPGYPEGVTRHHPLKGPCGHRIGRGMNV
jgi:hypothetical protein